MTATIQTETITATMEVSIGIDDEERENFDSEFRTEQEHAEKLAEDHVCDGDTLRNPQSTAVSSVEEKGHRTVYTVTVHFMEKR